MLVSDSKITESFHEMEVSISELSYLKSQLWILENRSKEENKSITNLTVSLIVTVEFNSPEMVIRW